MVPIPNLPTDNMYKFMAVCGVTCVVVSAVLAFQIAKEHDATIRSMSDSLREKISTSAAKLGQDPEQLKIFGGEEEPSDALKIRIDKLQLVTRNLQWLKFVDSVAQCTVFLVLFFVGGFLSFIGFFYWYTRVQKLQDAILLAQYVQETAKKA
ncbi:hypothetical protein [Schlesneria sp. DSM 10557]|uniref:hypothetical protein n=1 Tax=Schlesneria sp. DSM 10557 TaxID=3044399 RepID=UPI0035A1417A